MTNIVLWNFPCKYSNLTIYLLSGFKQVTLKCAMTTVYNNTVLYVLYWHGLPSNEPTDWTCYRSWPILADDNYGTQRYRHRWAALPLHTPNQSTPTRRSSCQSWVQVPNPTCPTICDRNPDQRCSCCRSTCMCQTILTYYGSIPFNFTVF